MTGPDFERARAYVLDRLASELPPKLPYHSLSHTRDEVLPAAERLAELEGIGDGAELLALRTAALYHDIGFVEAYDGHELASIRIAGETLPGFGYLDEQVERVGQLIRVTIMPQSPGSRLGMLLADADLDVLGREDFLSRSEDLRLELAARGIEHRPEAWHRLQLRFMESHRYFSGAAIALRGPGKRRNIERVKALLAGQDLSTRPGVPVAGNGEPAQEDGSQEEP